MLPLISRKVNYNNEPPVVTMKMPVIEYAMDVPKERHKENYEYRTIIYYLLKFI